MTAILRWGCVAACSIFSRASKHRRNSGVNGNPARKKKGISMDAPEKARSEDKQKELYWG
jgi:hypothetical protein